MRPLTFCLPRTTSLSLFQYVTLELIAYTYIYVWWWLTDRPTAWLTDWIIYVIYIYTRKACVIFIDLICLTVDLRCALISLSHFISISLFILHMLCSVILHLFLSRNSCQYRYIYLSISLYLASILYIALSRFSQCWGREGLKCINCVLI